ncbi:aldo/keto reductase [Thermogymnomonas acidicola]|uniref:Aldo/keto reductase n=1 Tax=Thermogymnomonas acidicola TaxID=399579 RepID=A0AA37BTJ0_9ARCH|nr:aldo/keto reductase [Thermogymnomonas acidicola]GGM79294.1 aldo/keto reductase [Thermogymnomonas acidicola]
MRYTDIGGARVSQIAIGTWHLPPSTDRYEDGILRVDRERTMAILKRAYDLGINFFDTANTYHGTVSETHLHPEKSGNSERILGEFMRGHDRASLFIATKVRAEVETFPNGGGLSRKHIMWQVRESLRRLGTDYIDLYQVHWPDPHTDEEEVMGALNDTVHSGMVHYIGVSNHPWYMVKRMIEVSERSGYERPVSAQEAYNIVTRYVERRLVPLMRSRRMTMIAYVPLAQGILTGKYLKDSGGLSRAEYTPEMREEVERHRRAASVVSETASDLGITPAQLSLAWILSMQRRLGISIVPLIGVSREEQLLEDVEAIDVSLPEWAVSRLCGLYGPDDTL